MKEIFDKPKETSYKNPKIKNFALWRDDISSIVFSQDTINLIIKDDLLEKLVSKKIYLENRWYNNLTEKEKEIIINIVLDYLKAQ